MKRLYASVAILALSGGLALAQSATPSAGTTGSNATAQQSGAGTPATPGAAVSNPNSTGTPAPGLATPSTTNDLTVGRGPGVNPGNAQDATRRGNPSDRTLRGSSNPQDMKAFDEGIPQIIKPERR